MTKSKNTWRRVLAYLLACVMVMSLLPANVFAEGEDGQDGGNSTYVLEAKDLDVFTESTKSDGDTQKAGTDDFFTLIWSAKTKVETSGEKEWTDGYKSVQRINFGGTASTTKNAVKFVTTEEATVKVWWVEGGENHRQMVIMDDQGETAAITSGEHTKNAPYLDTLKLDSAGTYFLGGDIGNNYIFKVEVTTGEIVLPPRADWTGVADPAITNVAVEGGSIKVTVSGLVGYDGADKVTVTMKDAKTDAVVEEKSSAKETGEHVITFTPSASGQYYFSVVAVRAEEETELTHSGTDSESTAFALPLETPLIKSAANAGGGSVSLEWDPVPEATGYQLTITPTDDETAGATSSVEGTVFVTAALTVGKSYRFDLVAVRGEDVSEKATATVTVTEEAETAWSFVVYGSSTDLKNNGYEGKANDGEVRVYSMGGKGKIVPNSTDGVAFYYTKVPVDKNFTLSATANVKPWTYSNGQEGFGLMAADRIGKHGSSATLWNNSYMAAVTKVEYFWDGEKVADAGDKITMKQGVGSLVRVGVTLDNISAETGQLIDMDKFSSTLRTLEHSCAAKGAGTYNIVGNATNNPTGTVENPLTAFKLQIQKNNTGYFVSYTDPEGVTTTEKYYGTDDLNALDKEYVYVGFFASRNADVNFTDINFTTIDPKDDAPAEERPVTYVTPNYYVESATIANREDNEIVYYGNADGTLVVKTAGGEEVFNGEVTANTKVRVPVQLSAGENVFTLTMTPDLEYKPSTYERLSSYAPATLTHTVDFSVNDADVIYVAPDGVAGAEGTKDAPASLAWAVNRAKPGQTIYLMEGTYAMDGKLVIERGINGKEDAVINLFADPEAETRPVLDFGKQYVGVVLAADYWHFKGFDVTGSKDAEKGLQVSGSHNVVEQIHTYKNGNTGLQISRYKSIDSREEWPSNNLILNCTSMFNADKGYEDADGFAAKLTIGEGNIFDGCISAYNADDGWDLFAKVETGPIGRVVIRNSVAYKNGYILDEEGKEINAGNGNGFKMGGESITGYHTLINSIAFANKAKGIDSNSCPDIQINVSTSFNNEGNNVAFYTNVAANTDYYADGVLSYKNAAGNNVAENIKPAGTQDPEKIYSTSNFYYKDGSFVNTEGLAVADDWFVSTDMEAAINGGITRNPDGSINMNGFLEPTDKAPLGVGARMPEYVEPVPEIPDYKIVKGANQIWTKGSKMPLVLVSDAPYEAFCEVRINGAVISPLFYTVREDDGTKVTLKVEYLEQFVPGLHKITIVSVDGEASTFIAVNDSEKTAKALFNILKTVRNVMNRVKNVVSNVLKKVFWFK